MSKSFCNFPSSTFLQLIVHIPYGGQLNNAMDDTIISTFKNVDIISEDFWSVLPSQNQMMENQTELGLRLGVKCVTV